MDRCELIDRIVFADRHLISYYQYVSSTADYYNDWSVDELQELALYVGVDISQDKNDDETLAKINVNKYFMPLAQAVLLGKRKVWYLLVNREYHKLIQYKSKGAQNADC